MMDLESAYQTLDVSKNATFKQIKQQYRDLATIWHPDRHPEGSSRHSLALDKMKKLNDAYDTIVKYLSSEKAKAEESHKTDHSNIIVTCPSCKKKNRLPENSINRNPVCGYCKSPLYQKNESTYEKNRTRERILCGDDSCVGTIGESGRCNYCGKTYGEGVAATKYQDELNRRANENQNSLHRRTKNVKVAALFIGLVLFAFFLISQTTENGNKNKTTPKVNIPIQKAPLKKENTPHIKIKPNLDIFDLVAREKLFTYESLNRLDLKNDEIQLLQLRLFFLGYDVGAPDGVLGNKTISALNNFSLEYLYMPNDKFPKSFLESTSFHFEITQEHKDWKEIYLSGELEDWINGENNGFRKRVIDNGIDNPNVIIHLLRLYKFKKYNPKPRELPNSGIFDKDLVKGIAPLEIKTKDPNQHYFVKLVNADANEKVIIM